jgi:hypothetical protein
VTEDSNWASIVPTRSARLSKLFSLLLQYCGKKRAQRDQSECLALLNNGHYDNFWTINKPLLSHGTDNKHEVYPADLFHDMPAGHHLRDHVIVIFRMNEILLYGNRQLQQKSNKQTNKTKQNKAKRSPPISLRICPRSGRANQKFRDHRWRKREE